MKRKISKMIIIAVAVVSLVTLTAFAVSIRTSCPRCGNTAGTYVEKDSDKYHETHCACGAVYFQSHSWFGDTCWKCGY